jgi:hypothetical protein
MSPDGRRIGLERDGSVVETVDLARGTRAVVVPAAVGTNFPLWTTDGTRLVFRRYNVPFWAAADGSGKSGLVPNGDANTSPSSAGPDADTFLAVRLLPETAGDLYLLSLSGAFPAKPLVATPAYEGSPHLSPDKRWLLYQSCDGPTGGLRSQVSGARSGVAGVGGRRGPAKVGFIRAGNLLSRQPADDGGCVRSVG